MTEAVAPLLARALAVLLFASPALGAAAGHIGLPGQVAPFVVMDERDVEAALSLAQVRRGDRLIDLGSGDRRVVISAARRGARALGVELNPALVLRARRAAAEAGLSKWAQFVEGDLFAQDLRGATVVTLYLFPDANRALRPKLLRELQPGARIVSNSFDLGDWRPDTHIDAASSGGLLLWIVPARMAGCWRLPSGAHFTLTQRYQRLTFDNGLAALALAPGWEATVNGWALTGVGPQGPFEGQLKGAQLTLQSPGQKALIATACTASRSLEDG
jgi:hypothetical protein